MPTTTSAAAVKRELRALADPDAARFAQRFFKTGPGEYAEGDVFLGIRVPELRRVARAARALSLAGLRTLLRSRTHEDRIVALLILVDRYARGNAEEREAIYRLYLDHTACVNNWDLVDCSAPHIVGRHLAALPRGERARLDRLAASESLWERRIAIIATQHFIHAGDFADTFRIADALLDDPDDLIHKAVGWMLREVGKRDQRAEEDFLRPRYRRMPRTMLRYAIERFPEPLRLSYLRGEA